MSRKRPAAPPPADDTLRIRASTAEFLIFTQQAGEPSIEVRYEDETIWLTQKLMAALFDVDVRTISEHLRNIYTSGELDEAATIRNFRTVQTEGSRQVAREVAHYHLDAIISVGYRVNSVRATQFRRWATQVLREFAIRGYVLDKKRLENGAFLGVDYFARLLEEIREIRLSERHFYQKITDLYATAIDYDAAAPATRAFFAKVQNKLHYAIHGHTAAELIRARADASKPHMGLTTWDKAPHGRILKSDVAVAKNYLTREELEALGRLVNSYLDLAEDRARRHIPMTMEDWAKQLDRFLELTDRGILQGAGSIGAEAAQAHAESEFEKYRRIQEAEYVSDFDRAVKERLAADTEDVRALERIERQLESKERKAK
ncbi:virulence RhuM family protein [Pseudoxanthomonas suwonensis]|uniref:virulence RhuM family protein n=1 Tax=Pseudoxanthomonas suwonensis TaxID=314722 RepID=UPI0004BAEEA2|nr:virulence RhuM family protein [Pseudoxanthomonas suwonensis]